MSLRNINDLVEELGQYAQHFINFQTAIGERISKIIHNKKFNTYDINKRLPDNFPDIFWIMSGHADLKIKDIFLLEDILGEKIITVIKDNI